MSVATAVRAQPRPQLRGPLAGALLAVAAVAWLLTVRRMRGMDDGPGTDPGSLAFFVPAWTLMMAAMMLPSAWPMVVVHRRLAAARSDRGATPALGGSAALLAGYLAAWTGFGLLAYGAIAAGRALLSGPLAWHSGGRWLAAGVLLAAAAYQLSPAKDACLRHCRGPLSFVLDGWREGRFGALRTGAEQGMWCVGCCWGLMAALFALGVMSITWMIVVGALIAVEKLLPWRRVALGSVTATLLVLGLAVAATPGSLPGLKVPARHGAMSMSMR
jgi:predicted metal-binding membrane protein